MSIRQARKSDGNRDRYGRPQLTERTLRIARIGQLNDKKRELEDLKGIDTLDAACRRQYLRGIISQESPQKRRHGKHE